MMNKSGAFPLGQTPLSIGEQRYLDRALALANSYAQAASAQATERAYGADFADFADFAAWCEPLGLEALPATPETVSADLAALADTGLKASTIRRRKAAIAYTHRWCGFEPPTNADVVKKTLAGNNRDLGTAPKQKPAATADVVERVIQSIPTATPTDLRDRALILLGFSGAFRRSELVGIDVEHIQRAREGIVIRLEKSKTDQEGRGHVGPIPKGRLLRPVTALDAYLDAAGITEGAVFRQSG
jgi:site-specific recombinase XerD